MSVVFFIFSTCSYNCLTEFNEASSKARSQRPLPSLRFSGRCENRDGHLGLQLSETFSTFPLKPPNGLQHNLTGRKISMFFTKFVGFSGQSENQDGRPGLWLAEIFCDFCETAEQNSTKRDRKRDVLKRPRQVFALGLINQDCRPASDMLRHFRLLVWNRWTEFN